MARNRIKILPGETEIGRSLKGKAFLQADGRIRAISCLSAVHWHDGLQWVDVDDTPTSTDGGKTWSTPSTPYHMVWDSETLTLSFTSKKGGDARVRLASLDGMAVEPQKDPPTVIGQSIRAFVAPELEIELRVRPQGVEIFKILHGPSAPRSLTWEVVEGDTANIGLNLMETRGRDNLLGAVKRHDQFSERRLAELIHVRSADDLLANPGKKTYTVTETFTGRTRLIDPATRARTWADDVAYPVEIDVTVTVSISVDTDDGWSKATNEWYSTATLVYIGGAFSHADHGGFRFQSVNVPQGQALDSVTLTVNVVGSFAGTESGTLAGQAVDDAPSWANYSANSIQGMAATAASVSVPTPAATGLLNIDVKSICQEIINRAGWVANRSLRLGFTDVSGMPNSYWRAEDYGAPGTQQAQLQIVYTPAGGGFPPVPESALMHDRLNTLLRM
jgi:hypothetical protein